MEKRICHKWWLCSQLIGLKALSRGLFNPCCSWNIMLITTNQCPMELGNIQGRRNQFILFFIETYRDDLKRNVKQADMQCVFGIRPSVIHSDNLFISQSPLLLPSGVQGHCSALIIFCDIPPCLFYPPKGPVASKVLSSGFQWKSCCLVMLLCKLGIRPIVIWCMKFILMYRLHPLPLLDYFSFWSGLSFNNNCCHLLSNHICLTFANCLRIIFLI